MSPITHALIGWSIASAFPLNRRERGLVTLAGVIPDFDGMGVVIDLVSRHSQSPTDFWGTYHHILGHNLFVGVLVSLVAFFLSNRRWTTAGLVLLSFHLHILGDVMGGRGPDGDQWPIPYLIPFTDAINLIWSGQWPLNGWPNFLITGVLMMTTMYIAWRKGISPLEFISEKVNRIFVMTLRARFGHPVQPGGGDRKPLSPA